MGRKPKPPEERVDWSQLATRLPADLHECLREHSEETGIPQSRIIRDALTAYLEKRFPCGEATSGQLERQHRNNSFWAELEATAEAEYQAKLRARGGKNE
jgi:predicted GNAT superfamily acetyltransferase